jgi:hypothetical protein
MRSALGASSVALWLSLAAITAGCGSTRSDTIHPAGFLGDYSTLRPASDGGNALVYVSRPGVLGEYERFLLDPVLIYFHPESKADAVSPEELQRLASALRDAVIEELEDGGYSVVHAPGAGVLRVRAAITDVDAGRPVANVAAKVAGSAAIGAGFLIPAVDIGRASIEAEMIDTETGGRVAAFADAKKGKRFMGTMAATQKWGHAKAAFKSWAKQFRERLDAAHAAR